MPRKIPQTVVDSIRKMRQRGLSMNEIRQRYPIGYGTVFRYIHGVEILPKYRRGWLGKRGGSIKRKIRLEKEAGDKARGLVNQLTKKGKAIFLAALYWGEGTKKDFSFTNSDPEMIRIFIKGLKEVFDIPPERLRVSIRIYEDLDRQKCLAFWSNITKLRPEQFVSVNILKGKKYGKLGHGTCRVRVIKGGNMLKYFVALRNQVAHVF